MDCISVCLVVSSRPPSVASMFRKKRSPMTHRTSSFPLWGAWTAHCRAADRPQITRLPKEAAGASDARARLRLWHGD
jgi:hypothetical protein